MKKNANKKSDSRKGEKRNVKILFSRLSRMWGGLSEEDKRKWEEMAGLRNFSFKHEGYLSGFELFLVHNVELDGVGSAYIKDAYLLEGSEVQSGDGAGVVIVEGDMRLNLYARLSRNMKAVVYATRVVRYGDRMVWSRLRSLMVIDWRFEPGSSIREVYERRFGRMPGKGEYAGFGIKVVNSLTGKSGEKVLFTSIKLNSVDS